MTYFIIGSRGRLGNALAIQYSGCDLKLLDRDIYEDWSDTKAINKVSKYFELHEGENSTVFITSGLLDPEASKEDLFRVNFTLPKNIIQAASRIGMNVITFGSVMENFNLTENPYIMSKIKLRDYVINSLSIYDKIKHIQLHTLYGLYLPSPFMFLGNILHSIKNNLPFYMSSGFQLREYHHLEDEVKAINLIEGSLISGIVDLSHGSPVSLKAIAQSVFEKLDKTHLLQIGSLPDPKIENHNTIFKLNKLVAEVRFRETLTGINDFFKLCLGEFGTIVHEEK